MNYCWRIIIRIEGVSFFPIVTATDEDEAVRKARTALGGWAVLGWLRLHETDDAHGILRQRTPGHVKKTLETLHMDVPLKRGYE